MKNQKIYVCLDIEVTDLLPSLGEIIEIAAIKFEGDKVIDEFQTFVNPKTEIPKIIKAVTGITDEMVKDAPLLHQIQDNLIKFIGDLPIIGHNISFDLGYLKAKGVDLPNKSYDTWKLATILLPSLGSHSLESLVSFLKMKNVQSHRAMGDVLATRELFSFLIAKIDELDIRILEDIRKLLTRHEWSLSELFINHKKVKNLKSKIINQKLKITTQTTNDVIPEFDLRQIEKMFADQGKLSKVFKNFEFRPNQIEMMKKVSETFLGDKHLVCEAGPGVGKSLAYLLPAVYFAKANNEKVVISTYTLNLQDQLLFKDIPIVRESVNFNFKAKKLVGRENYLCLRRFLELKSKKNLSEDELTVLVKILLWMPETPDGILNELSLSFQEEWVKKSLVCSSNFCLKRKCPNQKKCFYYKAKEEAKSADIVIINHALLAVSSDDENYLDYKHLIIDEAHHLEDSMTSQLTKFVSNEKIDEFLKNIKSILNKIGKKEKSEVTDKIFHNLEKLTNQTDLFFGILNIFIKNNAFQDFYNGRLKLLLTDRVRNYGEWWKVTGSINNLVLQFEVLEKSLTELLDHLKVNYSTDDKNWQEIIYDLDGLIMENRETKDLLKEIIVNPLENGIYWLTFREEKINLFSAPLNIDGYLKDNLFDKKETVILASATLTTDQGFDYFAKKLGLDETFDKIQIPSHYDFEKQATVILPTDFPLPNHNDFNNKTCEVLIDIGKKLKGKTLVLFTSYSAIRSVYKKLAFELRQEGVKVLAQGVTGGKMKLLNAFKSDKNTILLGTSSFWEGVDIPGENLSCLVITKIPFEVPSEPIFEARSSQYQNKFMQYSIPRAILTFKQGFGRLIRSKTDKGVVVMLDLRLENTDYGMKFLQALPKVGVSHHEIKEIGTEVEKFLEKH
ncbi:MAG: helicase C-terminal domain-containing protein [Patescibacteria group bacterium]|jgi:DNA polymerase-3 subunit epsilon/ATP-dependent DNA helicase DinG